MSNKLIPSDEKINERNVENINMTKRPISKRD